MQRSETEKKVCPICGAILRPNSDVYRLYELFELWESVQFSQEVITDHFNQGDYTRLYKCPKCELEIFLPQIIGTPNFYLDLSKHEPINYYEDEKWEFEEALNDINKNDSILEVGCGPGNFLEKAQRYAAKVCGIEPNKHALAISRSKGLKVYGTDDEISAFKGHFDAAFSFHVLEHVGDPAQFMQKLCSWVKPGGKIGLSVPNQDGPVKFIEPCIQNMPPHHATRWHLRTFEVFAKTLGLKIESVAYEPLIARDHYYYSTHWVDYNFHKKMLRNRLFQRLLKRDLPRSFELIFKVLSKFNIRSIGLLKGQGMYVLLSRLNKGAI